MFRPASSFLAVAAATLGLLGAPAFAKAAPVYTGTFSNAAVGGYDAVAYFTEHKPVKGARRFATQWQGAEKDIPGFIAKGLQNWPSVLGK